MSAIIDLLKQKTNLTHTHISNILKLLEEGTSIPFIARYRKELTGGASDSTLRDFDEIYQYSLKLLAKKEDVKRLISERSNLTKELASEIDKSQTLQEIEDIYRPFKEKRNTRATAAIEKGLEPLAKELLSARLEVDEFIALAKKFVKNGIESTEDAIKGAQDIVAELYSDNKKEREFWRNEILKYSYFLVKKGKELKDDGIYAKLVEKSEKISTIPSHRYLAIMRGVEEKELSVKIGLDLKRVGKGIEQFHIPKNAKSSKVYLIEALNDGFKRLLLPSIEKEIHNFIKERSDTQAINTFGKNLVQLLSLPPLKNKTILGVDPAYRSGCKLAVLDKNGKLVEYGVIYPTPPQSDYDESKKYITGLIQRCGIDCAVIGNGTASRETQEFFARLNSDGVAIPYSVISEAGASIYSASKLGAKEYPNLDVTIRGAISIAERALDPMAALVKIDPKSLGIGQYQHDVDQKRLEKKLYEVIEDLVNRVGVDLNSSSSTLISYVAGIGSKLSILIVEHREKYGAFKSKRELLKVKGLGTKSYEQSAGFFRILDGDSPFDNTGIHPESYEVAKKLLENYDIFAIKTEEIDNIAQKLDIGKETLSDIIFELKKPGFDPREELPPIIFRSDMRDIKELKEGDTVSGVVRSITDFGAFIDIGLKNDGLLHISEISNKRISRPLEVLTIGEEILNIKIVSVDVQKEKVALSTKNMEIV